MRREKVLVILLVALLTGCNGLFADLYDDPPQTADGGLGFHDDGTVVLDCRRYDQWVYVDLRRHTVDTHSVSSPEPIEWDFALHHYDTKTHGATVCETPYYELDEAIRAWRQAEASQWLFEWQWT